MLPDTAVVDRLVDSTTATVGLPWLVPETSISRAKARSPIGVTKAAPSSGQLLTLAAADGESERQTSDLLRSRQRFNADWLADSMDCEVSAVDEAFATRGERSTLVGSL
jgi:hypothetical protein